MAAPILYFDLLREVKNAFNHRVRLVAHARQYGLKGAARFFYTTLPTVRKWVRRYQGRGLQGLKELSRAPHHCPRQMGGERERQVVALRRQLPTFAHRIQRHLQRCGIDLNHLVWQTDNSGEFIGAQQPDGSRSGFPAAVTGLGSQHERIPPAAYT